MILKVLLFSSCVALFGCDNDKPLIDCGNGYFVNPPIVCPSDSVF